MKTTFGVELECLIPRSYIGDDSQFNPGGHGRGNQIGNAPAGWTVERDGSVRSTVDGMTGVEVVSPILEGEDGLVQVVAMCDYLTEIGRRSIASAACMCMSEQSVWMLQPTLGRS